MPQKFLCRIGTIETIIYIIEDLGHSSGTPLKNCLGAVFVFVFLIEGLIRNLIVWETLHFQGFNMDMAF